MRMNRFRPLVLAALFAFALAAPARADMLQWGYNSTLAGPGALPAAGTSTLVVNADSPATGTVQLSGESIASTTQPSTDIVPISLKILTASAGDNNLSTNGAYSLFINLTDITSGATGTLTFTGKLGGSFTPTSTGGLTSTINDPSMQSITLGSHLYTVTIAGYLPPSPLGSVTTGGIGGHITVTDVPEPSTLILSGLSVVGMLFGVRRRRRRLPSR
jgi:hypothetical protein